MAEELSDLPAQLAAEDDPQERRALILAALLLLRERLRDRLEESYFDVWIQTAGEIDDFAGAEILQRLQEQLSFLDTSFLTDLETRLLSESEQLETEDVSEQVAAGIAAFAARAALYAGSAWTVYQVANMWNLREEDPFVFWDGPAAGAPGVCGRCGEQMQAGVRRLSETPMPGSDTCEGFGNCRHHILSAEVEQVVA